MTVSKIFDNKIFVAAGATISVY